MKVRDLMRTDVVFVGAQASLRDVARLLAEAGISGVPVVDDDGAVLGVLSETDIVARVSGQEAVQDRRSLLARLIGGAPGWDETRADARTAGEAMTSPAITIEADRPLAKAAAVMAGAQINRLPVVDGDRLVGIVTRADVVRAFARPDEEIAREIREDVVKGQLWLPVQAVTVEVEDGEVTLTGRLDSPGAVAALPRLVERVPGVVAVHSSVTAPGTREETRAR